MSGQFADCESTNIPVWLQITQNINYEKVGGM